jgi:hypothetical protein
LKIYFDRLPVFVQSNFGQAAGKRTLAYYLNSGVCFVEKNRGLCFKSLPGIYDRLCINYLPGQIAGKQCLFYRSSRVGAGNDQF